jgi:TPR repeat protein
MLDLYLAHSALRRGEHFLARRLFAQAGEGGDPRGWYLLGVMTSQGEGGEEDPRAAAALYERAARGGCADGAYNLAALFAQGRGVAQDFAAARRWYLEAAEAGDLHAQHMLGVMFARGEGGATDFLEASRWWGLAAAHGHDEAMLFLAHMYLHGDGAAADLGHAARWYLRAALAGSAQARPCLAAMRDALLEAAARDDADALYVLARAADAGLDGAPDLDLAERLYRRAARLGHAVASRCLGSLYRRRDAARWDEVGAEVARLYRVAGEGGDAEACHNLGYMYAEGLAVPLDLDEARAWFERAAAQGLVYAQADLSLLLLRDERHDDALRWLEAAAAGGLAEAMLRLGVARWEGRWVGRDPHAALRWMLAAVEAEAEGAAAALRERVARADPTALDRAARAAGGDGARVADIVLELSQASGG